MGLRTSRPLRARPASSGVFAAAIAITCISSLTTDAAAQGIIGEWAGSGEGQVTANIQLDASRPEHFLAEVNTQSGTCTGSVEVAGQLSDVAVAKATEPNYDGGVCRIELRLIGPDRLRVTEVDGCISFHGAACGFTGELTRHGVAASAAPPRTAERPPPPAGGRGGQVPWAPDCEFLHLDSAYAPVEVTGTVLPDGTDCYAIKPNAGTDLSIEVEEGRNIVFSISDVIDAVNSHRFRASGYGHTVTVGQLMRSATQEPYRITFSSGAILPLPKAASGPDVASVQARLTALGYDPGPVDGVYGRKTERAIRDFLDEHGMERPVGIDAELIRALEAAQMREPQPADRP